jgi:hypothetical protein
VPFAVVFDHNIQVQFVIVPFTVVFDHNIQVQFVIVPFMVVFDHNIQVQFLRFSVFRLLTDFVCLYTYEF